MSRLRLIRRQLDSPVLTVMFWMAIASGLATLLVRFGGTRIGIEPDDTAQVLGFAILFQLVTYVGLAAVLTVRLWRNRGQVAAILYG